MAIRWIPFLNTPDTKSAPPARPEPVVTVEVGGRSLAVAIRRNPRAKRYTLRITPRGDGAVVTIPRRGSLAEARAFVGRHAGWLEEKLAATAGAAGTALGPGASVPVRGIAHRIEMSGSARGIVRPVMDGASAALLLVPGDPAHAGRRTLDFLKKTARADLTAAVARHAATLGVRPTAIRLKDTTSRWGSASSSGTLCFSWRLVLAPPFVLDYLAAHEVAHLVEMNHSERFWTICQRLAPRTGEARDWLKANGRDLHRIG